MKFGSPPYPALALHLASHFPRSESFSLHSRSASRCRTLGRSRTRLAGLVPLMGKASVNNITVPLGFVVIPKALAMARLSAAASLLAILPPCSSRFFPLAPYCYSSLSGWHPTAHHRLATYCCSPAGTLLLLTGWHPTARRSWLASPLPGDSVRRLPFRSVGPSSVTPSRGIALPPWLCPTPWIDVMTCLTVQHGFGRPSTGVFLYHRSPILSPQAAFLAVRGFCFVLVSLRKGLGLSTCTFLCIVSLRV